MNLDKAAIPSGPAGEAPPGPTLSWRVHLLAEHPVRGLLAFAVMITIFILLHLSGDDEFLPFAALVFFITLSPFFLPTQYELTPAGVTRRVAFFSTTRRWTEFPTFYDDEEGVKLSTFRTRSRLEPFRGLFLRFSGNRGEVLEYIERHVTRPGAAESHDG